MSLSSICDDGSRFAGYILTQQVMDSMDQYMASAADTVVTKAKSICTAFPNVRAILLTGDSVQLY